MKVVLILVDGMRPDALVDIPEVERMKEKSSYCLSAKTVFPSVTLPCHMSLFHSVEPARHGTTTNVHMPQVRPINGLCDVLASAGKRSAFFYSWEQLRDLARPGNICHAEFHRGILFGYEKVNERLIDRALEFLNETDIDFTFLYLGWTDEAGHSHGWMSDEYMRSVRCSWKSIEKVVNELNEDYTVIVTADHGGHDRTHGTALDCDMTIPMFFKGKDFEEGKVIDGANIMDIAPTVAKILGVHADEEWEGKSLI